MNVLFLASNPAGAGNTIFIIVMLIILLAFTYFGMIRPQKKQQEQHKQMVSKLKKGDHVVMIDGLHGKIDRVDEKNKTVVLDADGIYLTFASGAIRHVLPAQAAAPAAAEAAKAEAADQAARKAETAETKPAADQAKPTAAKTDKKADPKASADDQAK